MVETEHDLHRAMHLVMEAGSLLLQSGGEVVRVQQTMTIMAESLGIGDFHVYVLTNGIFATALRGSLSEVRHIPSVTIHLGRVERVNSISRALAAGRLDLNSAESALAEARNLSSYGPRRQLLSCALGSACFAILFGGAGAEAAAAFAAGISESVVCSSFAKKHISSIFTNIASSFAGTVMVLLLHTLLLPGMDPNIASIGALMVLTPGVALTMGIRDLISADFLSGSIRLLSALLVAGCLAAGVALAWMGYHGLMGVMV